MKNEKDDLNAKLEPTKEEYFVKIANNLAEATQLVAEGFEFATEIDGAKLFRKRK